MVTNQVQYSLIDRRPEVAMVPLCQERGIHLFTYGTFGGGLLSEAYLGQDEPRGGALHTVSLRKYKQMVDAWGAGRYFNACLKPSYRGDQGRVGKSPSEYGVDGEKRSGKW